MTAGDKDAAARWEHLRPNALLAIRELAKSMEGDRPAQQLFDLYVYSKRVVAEVMEARLDMELSEPCVEFLNVRQEIADAMASRYGEALPAPYLVVPYGSKIHEKLFQILLQRFDDDVPADLLRVPTRDSVHSERRVRELRELGLDISTGKSSGADTYRLHSLEPDLTLIPRIIFNTARGKKHSLMPEAKLKRILSLT